MRKKYMLGLLTALLAILGIACYARIQMRSVVLLIGEEDMPYINVYAEHSTNTVRLWKNETDGVSYFFLPACVRSRKFVLGDIGGRSLRIDGKLLKKGDVCAWESDRIYEITVMDETQEQHTCEVAFMKSENIPAIFIDTASGSMEYLNADKEREESGSICIVEAGGNTEYQGAFEWISGRGNSTWEYFDKKPYTLKLSEKYPLCGLDKGDKWCLLALCREGSKLDNKVVMDLAEELGVAYSVQGTWADLYLNGHYAGNYLLTESVSVGEGRVEIADLEKENRDCNENIDSARRYEEEDNKGYLIDHEGDNTGGYLIEKDWEPYYELADSGFITAMGNAFTVKAPRHVSREQIRYIQDYVEDIEQMVHNGWGGVWDRLDLDSFTKRLLLDELSLNMDAGVSSMYFYKDRDEDKLYSGPLWDYDNAFGDGHSYKYKDDDYERSILDDCAENRVSHLTWYEELYETPEVQARLREEYAQILPACEELLDHGIDRYAQTIHASVAMDRKRWLSGQEPTWMSSGRYADYNTNIRYMKFFLAKRLNWLCGRLGIEHEEFAVPANGQTHTVTFRNSEGEVAVLEVPDGEELEPLEYDASVYKGWINEATRGEYLWRVPVYEDMVFYNERWE